MSKLLIIIPAWNEEEALPGVLDELAEVVPDADVIVVDDASRDHTTKVAMAKGVRVLTLPLNLGVGGAVRTGYVYAARNGYTHALQLDADGQHDPHYISTLMTAMEETGADLMIGARFAGEGTYTVHGPRKWAMKMLSAILSRTCHTRLTDTTSGFKLANARCVELFSHELPAEYLGDTLEALVLASKHGLKIRQVPVEMRERQGGTPSHSPIKAALFLGRAMLAVGAALTRPKKKRLVVEEDAK